MTGLDDAVTALREGFAAAAAACPPIETTVLWAGTPVRLRVAGPELAEAVRRPFAHLEEPGLAAAASVVELWAGDETGVARPDPVPTNPRHLFSDPAGAWALHVEGVTATALDRRTGDLVGYRAGAAQLRGHERSKPFPEVIALWLHDRGAVKVHGGVVADGDAGALVVGPSGAGKSTATLAGAAAGLSWLGDDQVAVVAGPDGAVAHSLYATARLGAGLLAAHPELAGGVRPELVAGDKPLLFLDDAPGVRTARSASLGVLVVPAAAPGGLVPLSRAAALRTVAPSTLVGVVGGGAEGFQRLGDVVAGIPAFEARHGGDPAAMGELLAEAIARSR